VAGFQSKKTINNESIMIGQSKFKKFFDLEARESRLAFFLVLPSLLAVFVILIYPLVFSLILSFTNATINVKWGSFHFTGLNNYIKAVKDPVVRNAFYVTIKFVFFSVFFKLALGIGIGLMLKERFIGRGIARGVMIIPWAVPSVVVGVIFRWLLNPQIGAVNRILRSIGIPTHNLNWLSNFKTALPVIIAADIWQNSPFFIIIILAGLQVIPEDLYEAASIDGAGAISKFWNITLPMIRYPVFIATLLGTIFSINTFDIFWIMTRGGPADVTRAATLLDWQEGFKFFNTSYASAISYLILLLALVITVIYLRFLGKKQI
jgi:multiple sugar transport system permease protein